jgi:pimeloyl-ACP methyl ester carboxylesterase
MTCTQWAKIASLGLTLAACSGGGASNTPDAAETDSGGEDAARTECAERDGEVVRFQTDDGITLEADLYTTGERGAPTALLLHMIPPQNDRTNYPPEFISALTGRGLNVLNVDRRGAGESEGDPEAAYEGPKGKLDVKAAHGFLAAHACEPDLNRLVVIGASNGTTTALDFTVLAAGESGLHVPAALVFLSAGSYTENQNQMDDHRELLEPLPMLFAYPASESSQNEPFQTDAPDTWQFQSYDPGAHGTGLFEANPSSIERVADFASSNASSG